MNKAILFVLMVGMSTITAYSQQINWNTFSDGAWNVENNWDPQQVPSETDDVVVDIGSEVTVPNRYTAHVRNLTVSGAGNIIRVENRGSLRVHGNYEQSAGVMNIRVHRALLTVDGDYRALGGRSLLLQGDKDSVVVHGDLTASPAYTFVFNMNQGPDGISRFAVGGTLTLGGASLLLNNFVHNDMDRILLFHTTSEQQIVGSLATPFGTEYELYARDEGVGSARRYVLELVDWDGDGVANDVALIRAAPVE